MNHDFYKLLFTHHWFKQTLMRTLVQLLIQNNKNTAFQVLMLPLFDVYFAFWSLFENEHGPKSELGH